MKKAREILGLPIILMDTGKEVMEISGVLIHRGQKKIAGFLVDEGGWFKGAKLVRYRDVHKIGKDAVLIRNKDKIALSTTFPELENIIEERYNIFDLEVIDDHGNKLGFIKDIGFDGRNGVIKLLEISGGIIEDVVSGRWIIPLSEDISLHTEKILVPSEYILEFKKKGGLKKYFSEVRGKED